MGSAGDLDVELQANRVRAELARRGYPRADRIEVTVIAAVLARTTGWELAAAAIAMWPRPGWVSDLIGPSPHDIGLTEMLGPHDRASISEWGHADTQPPA